MRSILFFFFFFKQKTAYEIVSRDWSSDVCSSDLQRGDQRGEEVLHRRVDDGGERRADDHGDGQVDEVAPQDEGAELAQHGHDGTLAAGWTSRCSSPAPRARCRPRGAACRPCSCAAAATACCSIA